MCSQFHLQSTGFQVKPFRNHVKMGLSVILTRTITPKQGHHIQKLSHFTHTEPAPPFSVHAQCQVEGTRYKTPSKVSRSLTAMPLHTIELLNMFCIVCGKTSNFIEEANTETDNFQHNRCIYLQHARICSYDFCS